MKQIIRVVIGASLFVSLNLLHAQASAPPDSIVAVTMAAQGVEPAAPEDLANGGTFWLAKPEGLMAPSPCQPTNLQDFPVYEMADGIFLVDETGGQVVTNDDNSTVEAALAAEADAVVKLLNQIEDAQLAQLNSDLAVAFGMDDGLNPGDGGDGSGGGGSGGWSGGTPINTNGLYLQISNVVNGVSYWNLVNGTNFVYAIESSTGLAGGTWNIETELFPTSDQTNVLPFTVQTSGRPTLFLRALDWTGVDSDGDGIPDWWAWQYWGSINVTDTNLDYSGNNNTFAQDYSNNITPTVFSFTGIAVTNNYVNRMSAPVQLAMAGSPYYVATLVDDPNFSDAVWNTYGGSSLTVNLGMAEGWHEVWIGLRGHGDDPSVAVWQRKRLKLDWTPPALIITNPASGTVDVPMIQLQGYSPEALGSISYDLSNAAGTVTNQQVLVLNQYYDTNTWEFTTNTFQAFDVVLTNGVNTFTLYATDLAGNTTTTNFSFTVDYLAKTNPPGVQITWPQDGTEISGGSFTVDGQVDDATITIAATITDANGDANTVNGLVERGGKFWVENLPLNSGTNAVTLTVTDAAGNTNSSRFNVVQSAVTLTVAPLADPQQLWQPTVNLTGAISDPAYAVWVNGVKGHNNGYGAWSASNVPVNSGGTASFTAIGYGPDEQQPDGTYGNP